MEKLLQNVKSWILGTVLLLFPLFFLPFTQEFFTTGKFYLLAYGALLLVLISCLQLLTSKKLVWQKGVFDNLLFLFLITVAVSVIISSPNKIQALLNPNFGPVMMLSLIILYFYLSRLTMKQCNNVTMIFSVSTVILSLTTIIFFFQPFKNINLPSAFQFLKNPVFTPIGNQLDLAIFLGFFVVMGMTKILFKQSNNVTPLRPPQADFEGQAMKQSAFSLIFWLLNLSALFLAVFSILRPTSAIQDLRSTIQLPPFHLSWFAAVEILKNPLTALFGVGVDNFSAIFTKVKDVTYNLSSLWQLNSFIVSRSTILHVLTETGIFGLVAFGLLLAALINAAMKSSFAKATEDRQCNNATIKFTLIYWLLISLFFPSSLVVWFLFFIVLSLNDQTSHFQLPTSSDTQKSVFDLSNLTPIYLGIMIFVLTIVGASGYFLGRSYAAEVFFKKSIDGYVKNNAKQVYDNQRLAVISNPYIERFRINFSQTNLIIANNIAGRVKPDEKLSEQDRQTITQAIQTAIAEAKAVVSLNPQKASSWENLALIYQNVINVAQGADLWTISSLQRAIVADPQNPGYRLGLGGVYYSLKNWEEASKMFEQTVALKPDWPNAYYNLAWSYFQKGSYQQAVAAMGNVLKLVDVKTDKVDYDKAQKELEEFKKKLPQPEEEATAGGDESTQLNLPTPPATKVEPKINLPKEASPEAK